MSGSKKFESLALFNGEILPLNEVRISPLDRGYHFGDGIYEVFRLYDGKLFLESSHWQRFERSLKEMKIECEGLEALKTNCRTLAALHPYPHGMLYLQVTRGVAPKREHGFAGKIVQQHLAMVNPLPVVFPKVKTEGCRVITLPDTRWKRCDIKSLNLIANCMGAQQAKEVGCYESLFINDKGQISEASRSNVMAVIDGQIRTMPLTGNILPGITRLWTLQLSRKLGIAVSETPFSKEELNTATEAFLTNTTADIYPIIEVDGRPVGDGYIGPISKSLMAAFSALVEKETGAQSANAAQPRELPLSSPLISEFF